MPQAGSNKSWFAYYLFDPAKAALARLAGSSNQGVANAAKVSLGALQSTGAQVASDLSAGLTANSAIAAKNDAVKGLEDGLKLAVDAYLTAAVPLGLGNVAAEAANATLDWSYDHAATYLASLFHHASTQVSAATVETTAAPQSQPA